MKLKQKPTTKYKIYHSSIKQKNDRTSMSSFISKNIKKKKKNTFKTELKINVY